MNLPEAKSGRWGQGLTKAKMADCRWLKPVLVGQFEFLEWTADNHLRHSKFVGLREDKARKMWSANERPPAVPADPGNGPQPLDSSATGTRGSRPRLRADVRVHRIPCVPARGERSFSGSEQGLGL